MAHIKKLVLHGFKSFARRTEIPFNKGINIIIGPNGSGKSNISDAICFVLGRLSAKSLRAEKSSNLVFMGSKYIKPAKEAQVELVFNNEDRAFSINQDEVALKRTVRDKGQSIYKINDEVKTRAEIIETLAQAGIDPNGFNMILQGQIQSIVRMHGEDRRKIIGEVAGISVYEWRKEKSLKELEKTEERLKEISTILRERKAQLNNLEREREQAKRFKELEETVKRCKATIAKKRLDEKTKEINQISKAIEEKLGQKEKRQNKLDEMQGSIEFLSNKTIEINRKIKDATGLEQSKLREEITNLKAKIEGLKVRKEGQEIRRDEIKRKINEMSKSIPDAEKEILSLRLESPLIARKSQELKKKKGALAELEQERKKAYSLRTELESLKERIDDKKELLIKTNTESSSLIEQIEKLSQNMKTKNEEEAKKLLNILKEKLSSGKKTSESLAKEELKNEKEISIAESEIRRNNGIKNKVNELELCPLCQTKITKEHIQHVFNDCNTNINNAEKTRLISEAELKKIKEETDKTVRIIHEFEQELKAYEKEILTHASVSEKTALIKALAKYSSDLKKELSELENKKQALERKKEHSYEIEEKYKDIMLEIEEISSRTEENVSTTLMYKERELEKTKDIIERSRHDSDDINEIISDLEADIENSSSELEEKENKESELNSRFKKMFADRDSIQEQIQQQQLNLSEMQSEIRQVEDQINYLKIGKSKIDGERQIIEIDLQEFLGVELLQGALPAIQEKLSKTQESLNNIGSINLRALEVYDEIKVEYDKVKEKTDIIEKEKEEIKKIIEEIDKKKKKTFMKTFKAINSLFARNFSKLSAKGIAYLELEAPEENDNVSDSNVNIVVKMAKGKYFDVHSLSGGEQTLVALSLLFAIQEYKPYHFYILDEIDAALDKRNSERLAALLRQYMQTGQYIIVTHNDAVILDSDILYGVSMHEGVSKVLSLRIN